MYFLFVFILVLNAVEGARILGVFSLPWYSHYAIGEAIFKELAARGHEVTVINSIPQKEEVKNYRDVVVSELNVYLESIKSSRHLIDFMDYPVHRRLMIAQPIFRKCTDITLQSKSVQRLLHSNQTFDLIILHQHYSEAYFGFMHYFKVPVVLVSTTSPSPFTGTPMGSPVPFSYMPHPYIGYSPEMNFWQRVHNTFAHTFHLLYMHFVNLPEQNEIMRANFPDAPPLEELMYKASLYLVNHHSTLGAAVPLQPNIIETGGAHVQKNRPLAGSLKKFLDEAKEGVVYFSMGSFLRSASLPKGIVQEILNAFSKLQMKVLWKWEEEDLPGKPSNVRIEKWLPQSAVLAHENVKFFITHGGRLSIIESLYFGKPILGIPVFAEQVNNVKEAAYLGYGIHLALNDLDEENLVDALREIIENPKYTKIAQYRSNALHDLPINPLQNAIYWIEYVIKYKDLPHLKNASLNLKWYQLLLLDVVAFAFIALWILKCILCAFLKHLPKGCANEKVKTT